MTINIRQAQIEDASVIAEVEKEIANEPGYFCFQPFEINEDKGKKTIVSPEVIYLVAEKEGLVVGHAFLERLQLQSIRHVAQLSIGVHKGYQGQGIGSQLLKKLIEWAKQSGVVEKIELNVRATNLRAIALYKKTGFLQEGCLKRRVKVKDRYIDD